MEHDSITAMQTEQDTKNRKEVLLRFKSGDDISISLIQRKCCCGYNSAYRVFTKLIEDGLVKRGVTANSVSKYL